MKIPFKKLKNGFNLPVAGLGTFGIGGYSTRDNSNDDRGDIESIIYAIGSGVTHIDTAEMYAEGFSEILTGEAIKNFKREDLMITTKVSPLNLKYEDVLSAAENSLKRLSIDYIDTYLIHQPNPGIQLSETIKAMDYLVEKGFIRNIGLSNFNVDMFKKAQSLTDNKIVANQVQYNLIYRKPQKDGFIDFARNNDSLIMAWRPIEAGLLVSNNAAIMEKMCKKYNSTPAQISINWLISQKNTVTIFKAKKKSHFDENLKALDWKMEDSDIQDLIDNFPGQRFNSIADDYWGNILGT